MCDSQLLAEIKAAFTPYIRPPNELYTIRLEIAQYVKTLEPGQDIKITKLEAPSIPNHVTGVRRQYLKALYANEAAKRKYASFREEVQTQTRSADEDGGGNHSDTIEFMKSHLELLKLRRQYQRNQILSHYTNEALDLAEKRGIFNPLPSDDRSADQRSNDEGHAHNDHAILLEQTKQLTRNLELAVLQANHKLQRERELLQEIKARSVPDVELNRDVKFNALLAVNTELTKWIEESLAMCDSNNGTGEGNRDGVERGRENEDEEIDYNALIDQKYEEYLASRASLISAAREFLKPIPVASSQLALPSQDETTQQLDVTQTSSRQLQPLTQAYPQSNVSAQPQPRSLSVFPSIDTRHLPHLGNQDILLKTHEHVNSIISQNRQDLIEKLSRLSDESHLLPAWPLLAHRKSNIDAKRGMGVDTNAELKLSGEKGLGEGDGETEKLLEAWGFAVDAAGVATVAGVERQVNIGKEAINGVDGALDGLEENKRLWERLR